GFGDIGTTLDRIVDGKRPADELRSRAGHLDNYSSELGDRGLYRIAKVDGARDVVGSGHQREEPLDQVVDIAEGAGLAAVAIEGDWRALQGLDDEVGDDAAVIGVHARAVGVEDADDADAQIVLAVIVEEQSLGAALALV